MCVCVRERERVVCGCRCAWWTPVIGWTRATTTIEASSKRAHDQAGPERRRSRSCVCVCVCLYVCVCVIVTHTCTLTHTHPPTHTPTPTHPCPLYNTNPAVHFSTLLGISSVYRLMYLTPYRNFTTYFTTNVVVYSNIHSSTFY